MRLLKAIVYASACVLCAFLFVACVGVVSVCFGEKASLLLILMIPFIGLVICFYALEKEKEREK